MARREDRVEADPHGGLVLPAQVDAGDAGGRDEVRLDALRRGREDARRREAGDGEDHLRDAVGALDDDLGVLDRRGEVAFPPEDRAAHLLREDVGRAPLLQLDGEEGRVGLCRRLHVLDGVEAEEHLLERLDDLRLDVLRRRSGVGEDDGDHRHVDERLLPAGDERPREEPEPEHPDAGEEDHPPPPQSVDGELRDAEVVLRKHDPGHGSLRDADGHAVLEEEGARRDDALAGC